MAKGGQQTLDDLYALQYVKGLTPHQVNIIRFLKEGYYQAYIARRLSLAKSYVNRTVKELEKLGLVTPQRFSVEYKGKRKTIATGDHLHGRATTYVVSPLLDRYLNLNPFSNGTFTLIVPHNIRMKYQILDVRGTIDTGRWRVHKSRAVYMKSWKPRGGERHLWHVTTKDAVVAVELHPKSIMASKVNRSHIMAETVEEATNIAAAQIQEGVDIWIREQGWADCKVDLASPRLASRIHYALPSQLAKQAALAGMQLSLPGVICDDSLKKKGLNLSEIEMDMPDLAHTVDMGLRNAANLDKIVPKVMQTEMSRFMPQMTTSLDQRLSATLDEHERRMLEMIQGGTTMQQQFQQMVGFTTSALKELQDGRAEIQALRNEIKALREGK